MATGEAAEIQQGEAETSLAARAADLIATCAPFDLGAVERAVDQFLGQLDELGGDVAGLRDLGEWLPSAMAVTVLIVGADAVRRKIKSESNVAEGDRKATDLFEFPGLPGRGPRWATED